MTDKEMIANPDNWPMWPFLPMKKWVGIAHTPWRHGCLFSDTLNGALMEPVTIYFVDLRNLPEKDLDQMPKQQYASIDDMLRDGWEVD